MTRFCALMVAIVVGTGGFVGAQPPKDAPKTDLYQPTGTCCYRDKPGKVGPPNEVAAIAVWVSSVKPLTGPDGKTIVAYEFGMIRGDNEQSLGTFEIPSQQYSTWGRSGALKTMDTTRWKKDTRLVLVGDVKVDPKTKVQYLENPKFFAPETYTPFGK